MSTHNLRDAEVKELKAKLAEMDRKLAGAEENEKELIKYRKAVEAKELIPGEVAAVCVQEGERAKERADQLERELLQAKSQLQELRRAQGETPMATGEELSRLRSLWEAEILRARKRADEEEEAARERARKQAEKEEKEARRRKHREEQPSEESESENSDWDTAETSIQARQGEGAVNAETEAEKVRRDRSKRLSFFPNESVVATVGPAEGNRKMEKVTSENDLGNGDWPILKEVTLNAVIKWEDQLREAAVYNHRNLSRIDPVHLMKPELWRSLRFLHGEVANAANMVLKQLYAIVIPHRVDQREKIVTENKLKLDSTPGVGRVNTLRVAVHTERFMRLMRAMRLTYRDALRLYPECLLDAEIKQQVVKVRDFDPSDDAEVGSEEESKEKEPEQRAEAGRISARDKLLVMQDVTKEFAEHLDELRELGLGMRQTPSISSSIGGNGKPSGGSRPKPARWANGRFKGRGQPNGDKPALREITCFKCHGKGHKADVCPRKVEGEHKTPGKRPGKAYERMCKEDKDETKGRQAGEERSRLGERGHAEATKLSHVGGQKDQGKSNVHVIEEESDDSEDSDEVNVLETAKPEKVPPLKATVLVNGREVTALLDTGAMKSVMRVDQAQALGLPLIPGVKSTVRVGNGEGEQTTHIAKAKVQLNAEAPIQEMTFVLTKGIPAGNYIIVGLPELQGYTIDLHQGNVAVTWHGGSTEGESVEIPDVETTASGIEEIRCGPGLTPKEAHKVRELVREFRDIFQPVDERPMVTEPFIVELWPGSFPVRAKWRPMNTQKMEFLRGREEQLRKLGIWIPSRSAWGTPPMVTPKASGELREAFDYREVNARTIPQAGVIPDIPGLIAFFSGKRYLAHFDLTWGYMQCPVEGKSQEILAMLVPSGLVQPTRVPYGVKNAPQYFQKVMAALFGDLQGLVSFFDDVGVGASSFGEYMRILRLFFERCRERHVRLSAKKSAFGDREMKFLGRMVGEKEVRPDPERIRAIREMGAPSSKAELQSFIGLCQWFATFVPGFSSKASPLHAMLHRNAEFVWDDTKQKEFERLRDAVVEAGPLTQWRADCIKILRTDASQVGIGAMLLQLEDGIERPLAYFSRRLNNAEQKYSTPELEMLAIVAALGKNRQLIQGPLMIETDHSNLQFQSKSKVASGRVQRWKAILGEFDYTIRYIPGKHNAVADYLSRTAPEMKLEVNEIDSDVTTNMEGNWMDEEELKRVLAKIPHRREGGVIILTEKPPREVIRAVWALAHEDAMAGHMGRQRTRKRVRTVIQWKGMDEDLDELGKMCPICQRSRARKNNPTTMGNTYAQEPFESVFMDHMGPLPEDQGKRYVLVMLDRFSHLVALEAVSTTTAEETKLAFIRGWVSHYGVPRSVTTDGGSAFDNVVVRAMLAGLKVQHHIGIPYHPEGHGAVERANFIVAQTLRAELAKRESWVDALPLAQYAMNAGYSRITGQTPLNLVFRKEPKGMLERVMEEDSAGSGGTSGSEEAVEVETVRRFEKARKLQEEALKARGGTTSPGKEPGNRRRQRKSFRPGVGDLVLVWLPRKHKLEPEWQGPFRVKEDKGLQGIVVQDLVTAEEAVVAQDHIAPFAKGELTEAELQATSRPPGHHIVEAVRKHTGKGASMRFLVKWLGEPDTGENDPNNWVSWKRVHQIQAVRAYLKAKKIRAPQVYRKKSP